jgi:hypothetical protein
VFGVPRSDIEQFIASRSPQPRVPEYSPMLTPTVSRQQLEQLNRLYGIPQTPPQDDNMQFFREGGAVKKFADGGPSSGVRRLEMSGYQAGGEVTDEMFLGTRPEDFPETSPVDKKAGELLRALSEGTRGFVGAEPIEPGSEAYRTGQALANMPAVGVVAGTVKGAGKAKDALKSMLPSAKLVDTPEFQNWFGRSKTVNEGGKPLVLYHATPKDITEFIPGGQNPELSGPAIWMTPNKDFQPAAHNLYTGKGSFVSGANVIPLFASVKNPLITSLRTWKDDLKPFGGSPWTLDKEAVSKMKKAGHDGIMYYDEKGNLEEVAVFKPTQVKSAISNEGTFSPRKKAITKAQGGDVSNDEFIQEMITGTRPTDLPVKRQEEGVSNNNSTQEMFVGTRPSDFLGDQSC